MAYEVKVTTHGQTTIPKSLREKYMIEEDDTVMYIDLGDHVVLLPVPKEPVKALEDLNLDVKESVQEMKKEALETAQRAVDKKLKG